MNKLIFGKTNMLTNLAVVKTAISKQTKLPILSAVKIETTDDSTFKMVCTDLEMAVTAHLSGFSDGTVFTAINVAYLESILGIFKSDTITLEQGVDSVVMFDAETRLTLNKDMVNDAFDFPTVPERDTTAQDLGNVSACCLTRAFKKLLKYVSSDEGRIALTGVFFEADQTAGTLTAVATDTHRLIAVPIQWEQLPPRVNAVSKKVGMKKIFQRNELDEIMCDGNGREIVLREEEQFEDVNVTENLLIPAIVIKRLKLGKSMVRVFKNDRNDVMFAYDNIVISMKQIDANYPPFRRVIPTERDNMMKADRGIFIDMVTRLTKVLKITDISKMVMFANDEEQYIGTADGSVKMKMSPEFFQFDFAWYRNINTETGKAHMSRVPELENNEIVPFRYGINNTFLLDALSMVDSEKVILRFADCDGLNPILIEDGDEKHVIMPMQI
jgi:DNA polymerase III sliding clamp (beta) subunit (PCNA family)